jgi:D-alanyl-D-alanine carboxypeptidase/D-alanyl-D-alanine-endopeptidase (penicillin-binding protein 4)
VATVSRLATLAGGIAALSAMLAAAVAGAASVAPAPTPAPRAALLDDGGVTPIARPGTRAAARTAISKSELQRRLERELDRVGGGSGAWVADVRASGGGEVLFSDSGSRARILASNTKLFTTAAFLDRFGADGNLRTAVWARGRRAGQEDQILRGGLMLVGDGDPALGSPGFARKHNLPLTRLRPLARAVRDAGIRRIKGNLRADDTIFDRKRSVPQPGITGGPWLGPLSGLSYNSGFDGGHFASRPEKVAGREFVQALRKEGVRLTGRVKVGGTPAKLRAKPPVGEAASPSAAALIQQTNTPSDNFFAEMLLKRLAARDGRQGTTARGASKVERFAEKVGSGVRMVNGSGLSRTNVSSPKHVGKLLLHMARDDDLARAFRDSLAVAGRTGTLSDRMRGTAAEGQCRAKTGTIDGVSALSGYCGSHAGLIAFSILMNGVNSDSARRAQDAMAAAIARYG